MIFFNQHFNKSKLRLFIAWLLNSSGGWSTIQALERLKILGFTFEHVAEQPAITF